MPDQIEGIKQIGEWCKWYTAVDTAAIAGIGALVKIDKGHLSPYAQVPCVIAVLAFVVSIVFAAWMLSSLPEAVQDIQPNDKIWDREANLFGIKSKMWLLCNWQLASFVVGIIGFAAMVIVIAFANAC